MTSRAFVLAWLLLALHVEGARAQTAQLASRGVTASFGTGARLTIGEHVATLRAARLGRGSRAVSLGDGAATSVGTEVRTQRARGVVEWWRSSPAGLEHGVTIAERPPGDGTLRVELALTGLATRSVSDDAVALVDGAGATVATYAHIVVTDSAGTRLGARMIASPAGISLVVDDAGATYPVVVDPIVVVEEATLDAMDLPGAFGFGTTVSLSGDGSHAIVGASSADRGPDEHAGAARVYVRTGETWAEEATLWASDGEAGDFFGNSVSLSADGGRALVGAANDDASAGSAYVFVRSGGTWTEEAILRAGARAPDHHLGWSVSLSGDGTRAVVGASGASGAYVFVRVGSTWTEEATLPAPGGHGFGTSVSASADGTLALIGNPDAADPLGGSALVFVRTAAGWAREAMLRPSDGNVNQGFGYAVALSGDGSRAIVGSWNDDRAPTGAGPSIGSARVFRRTGTSWPEEATLRVASASAYDSVGWSVALSSDGSSAIVGANSSHSPRSVVFFRAATAWAEGPTIGAAGPSGTDGVGMSVSITADGSRALTGRIGGARLFRLGRPNGAPCGSTWNCASGFCADGVCCDTACGASAPDCQACSVSAGGLIEGVCGAVVCRPSAGPCDVPERCAAPSTTCPPDVLAPSATVCRPAAGACDPAETCTGSAALCPSDLRADVDVVCRSAVGLCDRAETCDGTGLDCPADALAAAGSECRAPVSACDPAETCDGVAIDCPTDVTCPPAVDAGPIDASTATDAAMANPVDAGAPATTPSGCGCRASRGDASPLAVVLLAMVLGAMRRSRRTRTP